MIYIIFKLEIDITLLSINILETGKKATTQWEFCSNLFLTSLLKTITKNIKSRVLQILLDGITREKILNFTYKKNNILTVNSIFINPNKKKRELFYFLFIYFSP